MLDIHEMVDNTLNDPHIVAHYTEGSCYADSIKTEADFADYDVCDNCKTIILEFVEESGEYNFGDWNGQEGFVSFAWRTTVEDDSYPFEGDFRGVRIYDALGGPTMYIDTADGEVVGSWWMRGKSGKLDENVVREINEYWEDIFACIK